jgi:hypothetical protein
MKYTIGMALLATLMMGCGGPAFEEITVDDPEAELEALWIPTAEELMLLSFLNDAEVATFEVLDVDCAIRSDSAGYLVEHRDGEDGIAYTADDDPFGTLEEVDEVRMVGPWTLERLVECGLYFGYGE